MRYSLQKPEETQEHTRKGKGFNITEQKEGVVNYGKLATKNKRAGERERWDASAMGNLRDRGEFDELQKARKKKN